MIAEIICVGTELLMGQIVNTNAQFMAEKLAPLGLKACHASYLIEICGEPGISQDKLAQRICINKSNVARQVAILEENGFVSRRSCTADKRVMKLYPTEKTLEMLPQIQQIMNCWEACLTHDLTEGELDTLSALLARMKSRAAAWMEAH